VGGGGAGGGSAGTGGGSGGAGGSAGGAGTVGAGGTNGAAVSFATDIYPIITAKCTPCHTKAANQDGGLNMSSETAAYMSLVGPGNPPTGGPAKTNTTCTMLDAKKVRVSPGDPTHSYMYIKITNTDAALSTAKCGPAMPETASKLVLSADQKTKIHDWIAGGATP